MNLDIIEDNLINNRISSGNLPIERLYPAENRIEPEINFTQEAKLALDEIKESPVILNEILLPWLYQIRHKGNDSIRVHVKLI